MRKFIRYIFCFVFAAFAVSCMKEESFYDKPSTVGQDEDIRFIVDNPSVAGLGTKASVAEPSRRVFFGGENQERRDVSAHVASYPMEMPVTKVDEVTSLSSFVVCAETLSGTTYTKEWLDTFTGTGVYSSGRLWPETDPGYIFFASNAAEAKVVHQSYYGPYIQCDTAPFDIVYAYSDDAEFKRTNHLEFKHVYTRLRSATVVVEDPNYFIYSVNIKLNNARSYGTFYIKNETYSPSGINNHIQLFSWNGAAHTELTNSNDYYFFPGNTSLVVNATLKSTVYGQEDKVIENVYIPIVFKAGEVNDIKIVLDGEATVIEPEPESHLYLEIRTLADPSSPSDDAIVFGHIDALDGDFVPPYANTSLMPGSALIPGSIHNDHNFENSKNLFYFSVGALSDANSLYGEPAVYSDISNSSTVPSSLWAIAGGLYYIDSSGTEHYYGTGYNIPEKKVGTLIRIHGSMPYQDIPDSDDYITLLSRVRPDLVSNPITSFYIHGDMKAICKVSSSHFYYQLFSTEAHPNGIGDILYTHPSKPLYIDCGGGEYAYYQTFKGCQNISSVIFRGFSLNYKENSPSNYAYDRAHSTSISNYAFYQTFMGCTSLDFPATATEEQYIAGSPGSYTFFETFKNCTSMTSTPGLMLLSGNNVFMNTFAGCSSLSKVTSYFVFNMSDSQSYSPNWLSGVSSTGTWELITPYPLGAHNEDTINSYMEYFRTHRSYSTIPTGWSVPSGWE